MKTRYLIAILTGLAVAPSGLLSADFFTYKDKLERTVTVEIPVKRAVLLTGADLLPVTGAWHQVAGISRGGREDNDLLAAVKPDIAQSIPSVGTHSNINVEALLQLKPDIVLSWSSNPEIINYLDKKGVKVIAVFPESIAELYEVMRMQGKVFGSEAKVETAIARMDEVFALIRKRVAAIPADQRKKAIWITGKPTNVAGRLCIYNDLIDVIGQHNLGREFQQHSTNVSLERIAAWNPDVIYIWGRARYSAQSVIDSPQWRHITAVKERQVFKAPKWDTWSPRLAPLALWLAVAAYPEQFKGIDVTNLIDKFYLDVYNISYSKVRQIEN